MKDFKKIIGKNIRTLRENYQETQADLSKVIGYSAESISQYEHGSRMPSPEVVQLIAKHFKVTEEDLRTRKIPKIDYINGFIGDFKKMNMVMSSIYPLTVSNTALKDPHFAKGYRAHKKIIHALKYCEMPEDVVIDDYFSEYRKSMEDSKTLESAANILMLLTISELAYKSNINFDEFETNRDMKLSSKEYFKIFVLNDDKAKCQHDSTFSIKDMNDLDDFIMEILKELKKSPSLAAVADFYLAFRFINGMVDNGRSNASNLIIGIAMMDAFADLGNAYANSYLKTVRSITVLK